MYNRYIPQPDGSYRRNRMQDNPPPRPPSHRPTPCPPPNPPCPPPSPEPCPPPKPETCPAPAPQPPHRQERECGKTGNSPLGFLKQLLPKDFDTGDLFVILLLLLMAGDCEEDRNNAILTLALYFIL